MEINMIHSQFKPNRNIPEKPGLFSAKADLTEKTVSTEERMQQVISPETIKGLLHMVAGGNISANNEHMVDITT